MVAWNSPESYCTKLCTNRLFISAFNFKFAYNSAVSKAIWKLVGVIILREDASWTLCIRHPVLCIGEPDSHCRNFSNSFKRCLPLIFIDCYKFCLLINVWLYYQKSNSRTCKYAGSGRKYWCLIPVTSVLFKFSQTKEKIPCENQNLHCTFWCLFFISFLPSLLMNILMAITNLNYHIA